MTAPEQIISVKKTENQIIHQQDAEQGGPSKQIKNVDALIFGNGLRIQTCCEGTTAV